MNNKGYMKTLEAVFAIVVFLIAVFGILSMQQEKSESKPQDIELIQDTILNEIEHSQLYRDEIINSIPPDYDTPLIDNFILDSMPQYRLDFETFVCEDINTCIFPTMSAEKVYADSMIIKEKDINGIDKTMLFVLYLWRK